MARIVELVLEARDRSASKEVNQLRRSLGSLRSDLRLVGAAATAGFAVVTGALAVATKTAMDAEQPWARLRQQLKNAGVEFAGVRGEIEGLARELQDFTETGDEETASLLTDLIGLTNDYRASLENLELVLDVSVGLKMDQATAARLVANAMTGNTEILGRYIPELKSSTNETLANMSATEKAAFALDLMRQRWAGMARAEGATFKGVIVGIKNDFGDMVEEVGNVVLRNQAFRDVLQDVRAELQHAQQWLINNQGAIDGYVDRLRDLVTDLFETVKQTAGWVAEHRQLLMELAKIAVFVKLTSVVLNLTTALKGAATATAVLLGLNVLKPVVQLIPAIRSLADVVTLARWAVQGLGSLLVPGGVILVGLAALAGALYLTRERTKEARDATKELRDELRGLGLEQTQQRLNELRRQEAVLRAQLREAEASLRDARDAPAGGLLGAASGIREGKAKAEVEQLRMAVAALDSQILVATRHLEELRQGRSNSRTESQHASQPGGGRAAVPAPDFRLPEWIPAISEITIFRELRPQIQAVVEVVDALGQTIEASLGSGAVTILEALGSAAVSAFSGFGDAMQGLLGTIGQVLGDIMIRAGSTIVMTSTAFQGLRAALLSLTPAAGVGVGLALVAAGAAMKQASGSFLSGGGGGGGGGFAGGGFGGASSFTSALPSRDQGTVQVTIEGGDVINLRDFRQREAFKRALREISGGREVVFT